MDINKALELNTTEGFLMHYYRNLAVVQTPREAYLKTEEEHRNFFKKNRYASWDSFRVIKNRNL